MATLAVRRYAPSTAASRKRLLEQLEATSKSVGSEITQYAICTPWDTGDDGPILLIAAFASMNAHDEFMASQTVKDLVDAIKTEKLLASPPELFRLDPIAGFAKEGLKTASFDNALVLFANADMHAEAYERCMPAINAVKEYCESEEPGTLSYQICKGVEEGEKKGYVVEVYESASYFQDPHMKAAPVQEILKQVGENADYKDFLQLKVVGGFLAR